MGRTDIVMFAVKAHQADETIASKTSGLGGNVRNCTVPDILGVDVQCVDPEGWPS